MKIPLVAPRKLNLKVTTNFEVIHKIQLTIGTPADLVMSLVLHNKELLLTELDWRT